MKILSVIFVAVVFVLVSAVLDCLFGLLLYCCGFKKVGHRFVAISGFGRYWLHTHCPYKFRNDCKVWTCPAYSGQHETCKCCPVMDEE